MGAARKVRVAVVFGGRSAEHAVSCASAGLVLGAIDRDRYDVVPIGIARDGRWVLTSGRPRAAGADVAGPRRRWTRSATPGVSVTPAAGPGGGGARVQRARRGAAELGEVDVVLPLLHGTLRRGRDDPGAARDGRDQVRGGRGARQRRGHGQGVHEAAVRGARAAHRAVRGGAGQGLGCRRLPRSSASGCSTRSPSSAGRCSSSRPGAGRRSARRGWIRPTSSRRRSRRRGGTTGRCSSRRRSTAPRSSAPCSKGVDGGPPEASVPGHDRGRPARHLVRLRGQVPGRGVADGDSRADSRRRPPSGCARWRAPRSTRSAARGSPGWTSSTPPAGEVVVNEINTMPGMTPTSGLPDDVGGLRAAAAAADRPDHHHRARQGGRGAVAGLPRVRAG